MSSILAVPLRQLCGPSNPTVRLDAEYQLFVAALGTSGAPFPANIGALTERAVSTGFPLRDLRTAVRTREPEVILAVLHRALIRGAVATGDFARRLGELAQELYDRRTQEIEAEVGQMLVLAASRRASTA